MDLFVVNRYDGEDKCEVTKEVEQSNLDKVLQRIEKNKKLRNNRKIKEREKQEAIAKTQSKRQRKRELKANFVPVPDNDDKELFDPIVSIEPEEQDPEHEPEHKRQKLQHGEVETNNVNIEGFTVLGNVNFVKREKVKRVLPKWLAEPTIISMNLQELDTKVSSFKLLSKCLRKKLKTNGVKYLFPVQTSVIPWVLQSHKDASVIFPRDICVSAPTGSGKTLAFALPIIQILQKYQRKKIRALVILPTQDLALQVTKTFKQYVEGTSLNVYCITGQNAFHTEQKLLVKKNELFGYVSNADILVCTAGRLVDHLKLTPGFDLHDLEFLVIDEADRVLDSVQNDWLYHLENHIRQDDSQLRTGKVLNLFTLKKKRPPQKLLFSATLSQDPEKLDKLSLFQPKLFTSSEENLKDEDNKDVTRFIGKYTTPKELTEKFIVCSKDLKPLVLYKLIKMENVTKTLVFTSSLTDAHRLSALLKSLFKDERRVEEISSHPQSKAHKELIHKFSTGIIDILICTDALARGIDLPGVQCVISYAAPKYLKTYIHRAGRTARAGEQGLTITLLHSAQVHGFKTLLKQADKQSVQEISIPEDDLESLSEKYNKSLEELKTIVYKEESQELKKIKHNKRFVKN